MVGGYGKVSTKVVRRFRRRVWMADGDILLIGYSALGSELGLGGMGRGED